MKFKPNELCDWVGDFPSTQPLLDVEIGSNACVTCPCCIAIDHEERTIKCLMYSHYNF